MIGIFDSGIGGLTVVKTIMEQLPGYDIIYFGDTARTPYGTKSPDTVVGYALENTEFLLNMGAKIVVIACNTASSVATEKVTENFDVPIFEVITPAATLSVETSTSTQLAPVAKRSGFVWLCVR